MAKSSWRARIGVACLVVAVAGAGYQLSLLGRVFAGTVRYPFDLEWLESTSLYQAYRYMVGLPVYGSMRDGFLPMNHPPGYTFVLGLLGHVFGLDYGMARTVSLLSFLGAAALVTRALVRHAGGRMVGWALAALAVGCAAAGVPTVDTFFTMVREDVTALFFCTVAATVVDDTLPAPDTSEVEALYWSSRRGAMSLGRIAVLSILLAGIVYTRQPAVFFVVWLVLFTFVRDPRSGVFLALGTTSACGLVLVALQFSSHGWYWIHTVGLVAGHPVLLERFLDGSRRLFALAPFAPFVPIVALVLSFFRKLSPRAALWVGMLVFSFPASMLPYAKLGGFSNDFVPIVFLIGPATAFVFADLLAAVSSRPRAMLALQAGIVLAGAAFLVVRRYDPSRYAPTADAFRRAEAFNTRVKALDGGVIISRHPFVPIHDGHDTLQWSDMPYLDMWWSNYRDTDLPGYIDRIKPRWALVSGNELPWTAWEMSKRFQLEERLDAPSTLLGEVSSPRYLMRWNDDEKNGHVLFDFESLSGWGMTGDAFQITTNKPSWQNEIHGVVGKHLANSYSPKKKDAARGTIVSPPFVIDRDHMSLRVGGGYRPGTRAELRVAGRAVRTATGIFEQNEVLTRWVWDVRQFRGQEARLALVDEDEGSWAHLLCDHVVLY